MTVLPTEQLLKELVFQFSRSSGPGGQNVNKVNTRVELQFDVLSSSTLSPQQKERILSYCRNLIQANGILRVLCDSTRSQLQNKNLVVQRFLQHIENALKPVKPRIRSQATRASKLKRLETKRIHSEKKQRRGWDY